jgi:streptogramin lyase
VGTNHGLDRFDLRTSDVVHYGFADGLAGDRIVDVAVAGRMLIWVLTEAGLSRLDPSTGEFTAVPPPPAFQGSFQSLDLDPVGGVWLGSTSGLFRGEPQGEISSARFGKPISALLSARNGDLWMGVRGGLVVRRPHGVFEELGAAQGLRLQTIERIIEWPSGGLLVFGQDGEGRPRIAVREGDAFVTYRPSPETRLLGVAVRPTDVVLLTPDRLYSLTLPHRGARVLRRAGMHLVPETKGRRSPYEVSLLDVAVPGGASAIAAYDGEILLGTAGMGTERVATRREDRVEVSWLRRRDLVRDAVDLSVACLSQDECYLATGTARGWRYDGRSFASFSLEAGETGVEPVILAFVRAPDGSVLALYQHERHERHERRSMVRVLRLEEAGFAPLRDLQLETPGGLVGLTFAKFSPDGYLWVGLQTRDEEGEVRSWGVASMDLGVGEVMYHREEVGDAQTRRGVLPVPRNVTDVTFVSEDELWFATINGAARLVGQQVTVFTENDGLESEILHGIVSTSGGMVFVASSRGVGEFDGARWTFPRALRVPAHALAHGADGRLWMGTDHGLLAYDGSRLIRVDRRRGLLDDEVYDVAADHLGRLWTRGVQGVSVVDP